MPDPLYESGTPRVLPSEERLLDRLVHALLPAPCLGCGRPLPAAGAALGLCAACRASLVPIPRQTCASCLRPLAAHALPAGYRCGPCRQSPPAFDRLVALWSYRPPLDAVVRGLKFGRLDYLGRHLAAALAAELSPRLAGCDQVVPVPLHWRGRLARGDKPAERVAPPPRRRPRPPLGPAPAAPPGHAAAEPARPGGAPGQSPQGLPRPPARSRPRTSRSAGRRRGAHRRAPGIRGA